MRLSHLGAKINSSNIPPIVCQQKENRIKRFVERSSTKESSTVPSLPFNIRMVTSAPLQKELLWECWPSKTFYFADVWLDDNLSQFQFCLQSKIPTHDFVQRDKPHSHLNMFLSCVFFILDLPHHYSQPNKVQSPRYPRELCPIRSLSNPPGSNGVCQPANEDTNIWKFAVSVVSQWFERQKNAQSHKKSPPDISGLCLRHWTVSFSHSAVLPRMP